MSAQPRRIDGCLACDGLGVWSEDDWDGEDAQVRVARCEACDATGLVTDCIDCIDCIDCDEPISLAVSEFLNGLCGQCVAAKELAS